MNAVAVVAAGHDARYAADVRAALEADGRAVSLSEKLPADASDVVLVWSAALEAAHSIDAQALIGLWSEDRLLVVARDATPLPLGLRDLDTLPAGTSPETVRAVLGGFKGAAARELYSPASPMSGRSSAGVWAAAVLAVLMIGGGAWYYFTAEMRMKQASLTAALESAAKASEELKSVKAAQLEALKQLEFARGAELAALKAGDQAKVDEARAAAKLAEAEAGKQAEAVKALEAAAADARRKAQDAGLSAAKAAPAPKSEQVAVAAAAPKAAEFPKAETPKAEAKAEAPSNPSKMSRSQRERIADEEAARKALKAAKSAPTQVASAAPSTAPAPETPAPNRAAEAETLFAQAQELEAGGRASEAIRIYRRAARAGSGKAAKRLGEIYDRGDLGVARDYAESLQWYETARQIGETVETASMRGGGGAASPTAPPYVAPAPEAPTVTATPAPAAPPVEAPKAAEIRKAEAPKAEAKAAQVASAAPNTVPAPETPVPNPAAEAETLFTQARELEAGGRASEAVRIYRKAARAGSGKAAKRLGEIYDRGVPGVPRDYAESLQWYETARQLGETIETASTRGDSGWARAMLIVALVFAIIYWRRSRRRKEKREMSAEPASAAPMSTPTLTPAADGATLFVSYSHKDRQRVEPIVSVIEDMGRRVWMDRTDITGQTGWAGQIVRAIRDCRAVVLMASPNSYGSDQVVRELYLAMNHKKTIVPIEIEPADLPDELQYILAPFQHHRLSGGEPRQVIGRALAAV